MSSAVSYAKVTRPWRKYLSLRLTLYARALITDVVTRLLLGLPNYASFPNIMNM